MNRHLLVFIALFVAGAIVALAVRAALHEPHTEVSPPRAKAQGAMVNNALTPVSGHEGHGQVAPDRDPPTPVNTVCAICGMDVDPNIPTIKYQGKTIGFGCRMCPPKFKADPDKYGPAYLNNETLKR